MRARRPVRRRRRRGSRRSGAHARPATVRASLCMRSSSSGVEPRLAAALSTARRSRRMRICTSSASACAAATAGSDSSRIEDLPDGGKVHVQFAQRPHQVQAGNRAGVVQAMAGRAAPSGRHDPAIGVEPDRPDRQPGSPGEVADRVEPAAVHASTFAPPPTGGSTPSSTRSDSGPQRGPGGRQLALRGTKAISSRCIAAIHRMDMSERYRPSTGQRNQATCAARGW